MKDVETVFDGLETRCPRLGGPVPFGYCKKTNQGLPCSKSLICWETAFPVREYMLRILTRDEMAQVFDSPPQPRLDAILNAALTAEKAHQG